MPNSDHPESTHTCPLTDDERRSLLKSLIVANICLAIASVVGGIAACFAAAAYAGMFLAATGVCFSCMAAWCICRPSDSLTDLIVACLSPFRRSK